MSDHQHCDRDPIECTYDALVGEYREAVVERDRLRAVGLEMHAERRQLWAFVDAAERLIAALDAGIVRDELADLRAQLVGLEQLDGTGITGGPPPKGDAIVFWNLLNRHADQLTGTDFNVIRAWIDCTIRPALFGNEDSAGGADLGQHEFAHPDINHVDETSGGATDG